MNWTMNRRKVTKAFDLRKEGKSFRYIADEMGISVSRARQFVERGSQVADFVKGWAPLLPEGNDLRLVNALKNAGFKSLLDVSKVEKVNLLVGVPGVGRKLLERVIEVLSESGISLTTVPDTERLPVLLDAGDILRVAGLSLDAVRRGDFGIKPVAYLSNGAPLFTAVEALRVRGERLMERQEKAGAEVKLVTSMPSPATYLKGTPEEQAERDENAAAIERVWGSKLAGLMDLKGSTHEELRRWGAAARKEEAKIAALRAAATAIAPLTKSLKL